MFRNKQTGQYPVSKEQIRKLHPDKIFPKDFTEAIGYDYIHPAIVPQYDENTQILEQGEIVYTEGMYRLSYVVRNLTEEELALRNKVHVPDAVTMRQARRALFDMNLLGSVENAINALPSPEKEKARIEWEYSQEVQRHNGFVSLLAPLLGLDSEGIDTLFVEAAKL